MFEIHCHEYENKNVYVLLMIEQSLLIIVWCIWVWKTNLLQIKVKQIASIQMVNWGVGKDIIQV